MRTIKIGQTTNVDFYLEGNLLAGRIRQFEFDEIAYEAVTHESLGMVGKVDLPARALQPIRGTISFGWLETELMVRTARPNRALPIQFEQFVDVFDASGLVVAEGYRILTLVDLLFLSETLDAFANSEDAVGREHEVSVTRLVVKSTQGDTFIREYAPFENINRVNGEDVWPRY